MSLALGLGLGIARRGSPRWTPAKLFAGGVAGAWYEPSPTTCYTDVAMTTLAGVGDTVAAMRDLSGNGVHLTQASAASQPKLLQDGAGRYYLETDGVDDNLVSSNSLNLGAEWASCWGFTNIARKNYNGPWGISVDGAPDGTDTLLGTYWQEGAAASGNLFFHKRTPTTAYVGFIGAGPSAGQAMIVCVNKIVGVSPAVRVNGSDITATSSSNPTGIEQASAGLLNVGLFAGTYAYHRIYFGLLVSGHLQGATAKAETWAAAKAGVTL